jgi:putative Holliday junction resolvase
MRVLGIDAGARRIGIAVSDATGTLARPVRVIDAFRSDTDAASRIVDAIRELERDESPVEAIVIGMPAHLDGRPHEYAPRIRALADALRALIDLPIAFEDERLTSHEAEQRLAARIRDWRERKAMLDAAAAAVILQDYLDRQRTASPAESFD